MNYPYINRIFETEMTNNSIHIIGRVERVDLPEWNISGIEAKIDTGAFSSSLHCHHIEEFEKDKVPYIRFNLLDPEHPDYNEQLLELPIHDRRDVKSSNGLSETRFFVQTSIVMFGNTYKIELSLTDRSVMKFPLLIGRKFLKGKFIVDVSEKNLSLKKLSK